MKAKDLVIGEEYQECTRSDGAWSRKVKLVRIERMSKRHGWSSSDSDIGGYYMDHSGRTVAVVSFPARNWASDRMVDRLDVIPLASIRKTWAEYEVELEENERFNKEQAAKRERDMDLNLRVNRVAFDDVRARVHDADLHIGAIGGNLRISSSEHHAPADIEKALSLQPASKTMVTISLADLFFLLSERVEA